MDKTTGRANAHPQQTEPAMKRTSRRQSTAPLHAPQAPPRLHEDRNVRDGLLDLGPLGVATVRIVRTSLLFYTGGRGDVPEVVYEAYLRTPRTIREKQGDGGWVLLYGQVLVNWQTPASALHAWRVVAGRVEAMVATRPLPVAADRPRLARVPSPPRLPSAPGMEEPLDRPSATPPPVPPRSPRGPVRIVRPARPVHGRPGTGIGAKASRAA
ncbi:MAG: hypothetical protein CMM84_16215 [Rhodothermaceae bacterium]|nr:hypothetical protein [Rhodothermaceae bacterium]MBC12510.1 hypothetical protein [Rhodothermaceae bacterium]